MKKQIITKYQIVCKTTGDNIFESYFDKRSAEYMIENYYQNGFVVEIELK